MKAISVGRENLHEERMQESGFAPDVHEATAIAEARVGRAVRLVRRARRRAARARRVRRRLTLNPQQCQ